MSFQIPAPIFRDLMSFRGPGFDPATGLSGDRNVTEGPESSDNPSIDALADIEGKLPPAEYWFIPTCSTFEDIQPETVVLNSKSLMTFPRLRTIRFRKAKQSVSAGCS